MKVQLIQEKIFEIRKHKVMLDFHLAELFETPTKSLNLAVKRNLDLFPADFMFQLTKAEWDNLRFQFETSGYGGRRYFPYAFTEHGVIPTIIGTCQCFKESQSKKNEYCDRSCFHCI